MKQGSGIREQGLGTWRGCLLLLAWLGCSVAVAQEIRLGEARVGAAKGHVVLLSEAVEVEAGKPVVVELRFRVDPEFHINSHAPKDELLIPTALTLENGSVKVLGEEYQPGSPFRLAVGAGETLDVYQGEFRVKVRLVAPAGTSALLGALRYQACDNAACFPPRTLAVRVAVEAR